MEGQTHCQSCSMPIEAGELCHYCTDDAGALIPFAETFERFVQFAMRRDPSLSRETAEAATLDFMARMPAWSEHTELRERRRGRG